MKEIDDCVSAKQVPDFLPVNIRLAFLGAIVSCDDEDFGVRLAVLHQLDPFLYESLRWTFAWFPDHQIDSRGTEEQLVCGPVDPLPTEIPAVESDLCVGCGIRHLH